MVVDYPNGMTQEEIARKLDAGLSAREVGRRLGVAHTTLLRAIRRADATTVDEDRHHAPPNE